MTFNARKFMGCSHLVVLGLGMMVGLRGIPKAESPWSDVSKSDSKWLNSNPVGSDRVSGAAAVDASASSADYAAAWDSLKGRFLPRQERLLIEKNLLEEWSIVDLEAAVRAIFAETSDDGPNGFGRAGLITLLDCCAPGIQADPLKAWALVRSDTFGLETGRFRNAWLDCMAEANPVLLFSILGELPPDECFSTLESLAVISCTAEIAATRTAVWNHLSDLPDAPEEQELLSRIGERICLYTPPAEVAARLLGDLSPAGRKIHISALALSLFEVVEDEDFPGPLALLPDALRGEVAAASLKYGARNDDRMLILANVALDSRNLDALQAAGADHRFRRFVENAESHAIHGLVDWALRLPDDHRTKGVFDQVIEEAAYHYFDEMRAKFQELPVGGRRNQGLEAVSKAGERRDAEDERDAQEEPGDKEEDE